MKTINAIGLMSGTSLDGTDLAACTFSHDQGAWTYQIHQAVTLPYPKDWQGRLEHADKLNALGLVRLHKEYGAYLGELVLDFCRANGIKPALVASHGHTVFHQPEQGLTFQLGDGAALAAACRLPVICDFRSTDVALGGQGAPLVPAGDKLLFGNYSFCLNLGGFSNISYDNGQDVRIAHDISPCNMALNHAARLRGLDYDAGGKLAAMGQGIPHLLEQLNAIPFYRLEPPKSLGREWFREVFLPLATQGEYEPEDLLATLCGHIAYQVKQAVRHLNGRDMLITGGGAHNTFLLEKIKSLVPLQIVVPDRKLTDFKEALVFAFLGVLRYYGQNNVLSSVTGASEAHCGGAIYSPFTAG